MASLDKLETVADIESCLDESLHQAHVLEELDQKWTALSDNLESVLDHLQECSGEVTKASINCLESLKSSVETTCDKVDLEQKALYHLITKSDELILKLSVAETFREEIKTLKKSVETLETLVKLSIQSSIQINSRSST